ncbi:MAG: phosphoribosylanthranilate isomerase [Coleofasciculaceae cyanobacterium]
MKPTKKPRVKVCCIANVAEANLAISYGASALGLVSETPSGSLISEGLIAQVASLVPPAVSSFLLTSKPDTLAIIAQQRRLGVNTIQIGDHLQSGTYDDLRQALPGISLVQVISVENADSIEAALKAAPHVHGLLLDSSDHVLNLKEHGGTSTHNWEISRKIRESVDIPVFLSGGLTPENVSEAIQQVQPFGVNVCSGVRTKGKLDEDKLAKFFAQVSRCLETA